jgi:hypothetical protein
MLLSYLLKFLDDTFFEAIACRSYKFVVLLARINSSLLRALNKHYSTRVLHHCTCTTVLLEHSSTPYTRST